MIKFITAITIGNIFYPTNREACPFSASDSAVSYVYKCECHVYTSVNNDTLPKEINQTIRYDSKGRVVALVNHKFRTEMSGTVVFVYNNKNQIVEEWRQPNEANEDIVIRTVYRYNSFDSLDSKVSYTFEKRLKKDRNRDDDVYSEEDYESNKTWDSSHFWTYKYDDQRRLIKSEAFRLNSNQDLYLYNYYSNGKLKEVTSADKHRGIIYLEEYNYAGDTTFMERTWYEDGKPKSDNTYFRTTKYVLVYSNGNLKQRLGYTKDDGKLFIDETYSYDDQNRLTREIEVTFNGRQKVTINYHYPKECKEAHQESIIF